MDKFFILLAVVLTLLYIGLGVYGSYLSRSRTIKSVIKLSDWTIYNLVSTILGVFFLYSKVELLMYVSIPILIFALFSIPYTFFLFYKGMKEASSSISKFLKVYYFITITSFLGNIIFKIVS